MVHVLFSEAFVSTCRRTFAIALIASSSGRLHGWTATLRAGGPCHGQAANPPHGSRVVPTTSSPLKFHAFAVRPTPRPRHSQQCSGPGCGRMARGSHVRVLRATWFHTPGREPHVRTSSAPHQSRASRLAVSQRTLRCEGAAWALVWYARRGQRSGYSST